MKLDGAWGAAARDLRTARSRFGGAIDRSVAHEAQLARKAIIEGIRNQAPAGEKFVPLSRLTRAIRRTRGFRGTKALIRSGALIGSIAARRAGRGRYFVGVIRGAKSRTGAPVTTIARMNEEGATFVVRVSPKMLRFLMANLRKANMLRGTTRRGGGSTLRQRYLVIRIPPRPFIGPVIAKINARPLELKRRMFGQMAKHLGYTLGR